MNDFGTIIKEVKGTWTQYSNTLTSDNPDGH